MTTIKSYDGVPSVDVWQYGGDLKSDTLAGAGRQYFPAVPVGGTMTQPDGTDEARTDPDIVTTGTHPAPACIMSQALQDIVPNTPLSAQPTYLCVVITMCVTFVVTIVIICILGITYKKFCA